jgi:hypothetical protein
VSVYFIFPKCHSERSEESLKSTINKKIPNCHSERSEESLRTTIYITNRKGHKERKEREEELTRLNIKLLHI